ncbi:hypothetical protein MACH17_24440 [Phaeobacter inhibens]|uniref:hypothetical protein n=1 Tax=Phaeobacter inhibens TaxID=221822 RepID=UPI00275416B6|nr:hypothetical protein [Phaeobacter inhibens]GLO70927.1 hypothetical protein MACH17_24440 [Phaeobacter inhibens]
MRKSMSLSLKLGGAGVVATGLKMATSKIIGDFTQRSKEIQRASGDLRALGMKDIQAVVREGRRLQNTYVGLTTEAFVRAAYDIRSGVSSLTDEGVAAMTASALTVAKATKGVPESMTSLFATSYGIFKKQFAEMSDADWGDMFGAALAKTAVAASIAQIIADLQATQSGKRGAAPDAVLGRGHPVANRAGHQGNRGSHRSHPQCSAQVCASATGCLWWCGWPATAPWCSSQGARWQL